MKNKKYIKTTITLYGLINNEDELWWEWFLYAKSLAIELGYTPNYIGVNSNTFKSGKVLTINRSQKKLEESIKNKNFPSNLDVYSLHDDFKQAAFDYYLLASRSTMFNNHNISITIPKEKYSELNSDKLINDMKRFINFNKGEIYELDYTECPLLYIVKGKPRTEFKGLNIVREL
jgi:hypothetical protein